MTGNEPINDVTRSVSGIKDELRKVVVVGLADVVRVTGVPAVEVESEIA